MKYRSSFSEDIFLLLAGRRPHDRGLEPDALVFFLQDPNPERTARRRWAKR